MSVRVVTKLIRNGWEIYFFKDLFGKQRRDLRESATKLKHKLLQEEYISHPEVKLFAATMRGVKEIIVMNPFSHEFLLSNSLKKYGRLKGYGIDSRCRLFFRAIDDGERKCLFILWLGSPRRQGDKKDCYEVFTKWVENGTFPETIDNLVLMCE